MKKKLLLLIMSGSLFLAGFFFSCTKETTLSDSFQETEELNLKSAPTKFVLTPKEQLGRYLYFDKISSPNSMACADCHSPLFGFTGPNVGTNIHGSVHRGADAQNFGDRKPPSAAYATFSPILHKEKDRTFVGGNFWDGRATGETLGSPAAEQALGPFLNSAEHNLPDMLSVLQKIAKAKYISMWKEVWGEPFTYAVEKIALNYDRVGLSIAAFEGSPEVNQFSSKYDFSLKGLVKLTAEEEWGLKLFNSADDGKCAQCHPSITPDGDGGLFTDFTFDNLGVPKNPQNPVYKYNPTFIDPGLGGYLATREDYSGYADANWGKHKVPTLRNVAKKPGLGVTKAYMHNGVFKTLQEVVDFYDRGGDKGSNKSALLRPLSLSTQDKNDLVAFMEALSMTEPLIHDDPKLPGDYQPLPAPVK